MSRGAQKQNPQVSLNSSDIDGEVFMLARQCVMAINNVRNLDVSPIADAMRLIDALGENEQSFLARCSEELRTRLMSVYQEALPHLRIKSQPRAFAQQRQLRNTLGRIKHSKQSPGPEYRNTASLLEALGIGFGARAGAPARSHESRQGSQRDTRAVAH